MELHVPGVITKFSDGAIFVEYIPSAQVTVIVILAFAFIASEWTIINAMTVSILLAPLSSLPYFKIQLLLIIVATCTFFNAGLTVSDPRKQPVGPATFTSFTVCLLLSENVRRRRNIALMCVKIKD